MLDSWDPVDYSLLVSSVHEILQARILGWVVISFSRGSSRPRDQTWVSCIAVIFFTNWAAREAHDTTDVGDLISGSSAFLYPAEYLEILCLCTAEDYFEWFWAYLASMWNECNCTIIWTFFGIVFLWDWNENGPFPVLWSLLSFPNLLAYWVQHFHSSIF